MKKNVLIETAPNCIHHSFKCCGVYTIRCKDNNKIYVGCSSNIYNRLYNHISKLNSGSHINERLLCDYKKYGKNSFIFRIERLFPDMAGALKYERKLIYQYAKARSAYNQVWFDRFVLDDTDMEKK